MHLTARIPYEIPMKWNIDWTLNEWNVNNCNEPPTREWGPCQRDEDPSEWAADEMKTMMPMKTNFNYVKRYLCNVDKRMATHVQYNIFGSIWDHRVQFPEISAYDTTTEGLRRPPRTLTEALSWQRWWLFARSPRARRPWRRMDENEWVLPPVLPITNTISVYITFLIK